MVAQPPSPTDPLLDQLTKRQRECLALAADGHTSKQIAQRLGITHHTVDEHCDAARATLGVATRLDAVRWFRQLHFSPIAGGTPQSPGGVARAVETEPAQTLDWRPNPIPERAVPEPLVIPLGSVSDLSGERPAPDAELSFAEGVALERSDWFGPLAIRRPFKARGLDGVGVVPRLVIMAVLAMAMLGVVVLVLAASDSIGRIVPRVPL